MGTQVLSLARSESKPTYVASTVAFDAVAVGDGELAVFVGTGAVDHVEAFNGVMSHALQALREGGWPDPASLSTVNAYYNVVTQSHTVTFSEDCVAIIKGAGYTPAGVSCSAYVKRMTEVYLEDVAKVS